MIYCKQTLTMNEFKTDLNLKELQMKESVSESAGDGLTVREKTKQREN